MTETKTLRIMKKFLPVYLAVFSAIVTLCGCDNQKRGIKKDLEKMFAYQITIPDIESAYYNGQDTIIPMGTFGAPARMIIYYDSLLCGSCHVNKLWEWSDVVTHSTALRGKFKPIFIFSPAKGKVNEVRVSLRSYQDILDWPVYLDGEGLFPGKNSELPANHNMHTFLLDKNNKPVLVGNPVGNEKLWNLYKDSIRKLIDNDGLMPEE